MIDNIKHLVIDMLAFSWPMVAISMVIFVSLRIVYLITKKERFVLYKEILLVVFVIYILCLFQVVTFKDVSWSGSNFIPGKEIFRYEVGSSMFYRNIFGNMLLFLPYGFLVSYFFDIKRVYIPLILISIASLSIELTQLVIGRVFDVDDILLNIIGGLIGYFLYHVLDIIEDKIPKKLKKEWILDVLVILLAIGIGCVLFL
ncbi:MAG TPA: VanZ family protein [Bacilli bacterium]|nr:VanZ family protein [Bacilli bacterium]